MKNETCTFKITGMSCAACQARVEKAASAVDGVDVCSVNLLTGLMQTAGSFDAEAVIKAVEQAGYGAEINRSRTLTEENLSGGDSGGLLKRLISSAILLIILMYVSMGHMMWGLPLPAPIAGNYCILGIIQAVLSLIIIIINRRFFINGTKGVLHLSPNMDTLVALGSGISYVYSLVLLINYMVTAPAAFTVTESFMDCPHLYFESAAMIVTLITVGKLLESISKGRTTDAVKGLIKLSPMNTTLLREGTEISVPTSEVKVGDVFICREGDRIPVDGVVLEGSASLDESALTGESVTVPKSAGDNVSTATDIVTGEIICRAEKVGEDTVLSRIIQMVTDATSTKAPIARVADKTAGIFVPVVLGIAAVTALVWALLGYEAGYVLNRAISVLVISCPCALGLATPVAIMVGTGLGSKKGILFKTAESLEQTGKPELIVLDKTGTVTEGKVGADTVKADSAAAIKELKKLGLNIIMLSGDKKERAEVIASQVGIDYCISQVLPGDKGMVIKSLKEQLGGNSVGVIMVGDGINDAPALKTAHIGMAIGAGKDIAIDAADVVLMNSSLRDVAAAIRLSRRTLLNIKENLFWAFIYNIICIPLAAGVYSVLLNWDMSPMVGAACMALSSVCVCLNALRLNLFDPYKEGREKRAPKLNIDVESLTGTNIPKEYTENSEVKNMEKIMKIEGMMCTHCSGRVKGVLEALDGVEAAEVSHETGEAVLTLSADVADEILAKAVTDAGYTVVG